MLQSLLLKDTKPVFVLDHVTTYTTIELLPLDKGTASWSSCDSDRSEAS